MQEDEEIKLSLFSHRSGGARRAREFTRATGPLCCVIQNSGANLKERVQFVEDRQTQPNFMGSVKSNSVLTACNFVLTELARKLCANPVSRAPSVTRAYRPNSFAYQWNRMTICVDFICYS